MEEYQHERELEEKRGEGGRREYLDKRKTRQKEEEEQMHDKQGDEENKKTRKRK